MQRMGMVIGVRPEKLDDYKALHAEVWPEMRVLLSKYNIRNYSIYLREPENLLFGYWEYVGSNYEGDLAALGAEAVTQEWLAVCDPCQLPLPTREKGEWWASMEEIFHLD